MCNFARGIEMTLYNLCKKFVAFILAPGSALPLALFRIIFGLVTLEYCILVAPELITCFSDTNGILRISTLPNIFAIPVLDLVAQLPPGDGPLVAFFSVFAIACFCLTIGLFSRVSSIIVYLGLVSFLHRNIYVHHGGDHLMGLAAFWMMFAPTGAALSVDRWIKQKRNPSIVIPTQVSLWAVKAFQLQFVLVYWQASLSKIASPSWWDGTAMYYVFRYLEFARFPVPSVMMNDLHIMQFLTWSTIAIEILGWTLIWFKETRYPVLMLLLAMHLGIEYAMNIPIFEHIMIASLFIFIRGEDAEAWFAKAKTWLSGNRSEPVVVAEVTRPSRKMLEEQIDKAFATSTLRSREVARPRTQTYRRMTGQETANV
jgi:hypothetical protein